MGLLKKKASFTVFNVAGEMPLLKEVMNIITNDPTPDIKGTTAKEAFSLCAMQDVFEKGAIQGEASIGFGVRHDFKSISDSKALLKKQFKEELKKLKAECKGTKRKIDKEAKQEIKERLEGDLYLKTDPTEKHFECLWDTKEKILYVGITSDKILAGVMSHLIKLFPTLQFSVWNPLSSETKHASELKGSSDNFQNAFFTWIFYETKTNAVQYWSPLNIKFMNDDATVSIKGDTAISLEAYFALYASRFVDGIDLSYKVNDERRFDVSLKRGSWSFRGVKITPDINFEGLESAVFERSRTFKEFLGVFQNLIKQFEEIRNDSSKDKKFWKSVQTLAADRIKREFAEA
jgi:hypothetical protein